MQYAFVKLGPHLSYTTMPRHGSINFAKKLGASDWDPNFAGSFLAIAGPKKSMTFQRLISAEVPQLGAPTLRCQCPWLPLYLSACPPQNSTKHEWIAAKTGKWPQTRTKVTITIWPKHERYVKKPRGCWDVHLSKFSPMIITRNSMVLLRLFRQ